MQHEATTVTGGEGGTRYAYRSNLLESFLPDKDRRRKFFPEEEAADNAADEGDATTKMQSFVVVKRWTEIKEGGY